MYKKLNLTNSSQVMLKDANWVPTLLTCISSHICVSIMNTFFFLTYVVV